MLIFLDIDGVMAPAKGWKSPELLADGFPAFSSKATRVLQKLVSGDTTVVLTTSHKGNYSIAEWKNMFRNRGISIEKLESLPANVHHLNRKDEIVNWFNIHHVHEDIIILDDDTSLNLLPGYLKGKWVQTSPYIGLTDEHLEKINTILHQTLGII